MWGPPGCPVAPGWNTEPHGLVLAVPANAVFTWNQGTSTPTSRSGTGFHMVREPNCATLESGLQFVTAPLLPPCPAAAPLTPPGRLLLENKDWLPPVKPTGLGEAPGPPAQIIALALASNWVPSMPP